MSDLTPFSAQSRQTGSVRQPIVRRTSRSLAGPPPLGPDVRLSARGVRQDFRAFSPVREYHDIYMTFCGITMTRFGAMTRYHDIASQTPPWGP